MSDNTPVQDQQQENGGDTPKNQEELKTQSPTQQTESQATQETKSEQPANQEVSYESLVVTLKEKNKQIKKLETFQKKIEERYKEKAKQAKDLQKDKTILEEFVKALIPSTKQQHLNDKDNKLVVDTEQLLKLHNEIFTKQSQPTGAQQQNQNNNELFTLIKEENENLKKKIMDMSQQLRQEQTKIQQQQHQLQRQNSEPLQQRLSQFEKKITGLEEIIKNKDEQIDILKQQNSEYAELKGKQLIQAIKAGKNTNDTSQSSNTESEENQYLRQQLSEKTNKILELTEKLNLANETVQALEESQNQKSSYSEEKGGAVGGASGAGPHSLQRQLSETNNNNYIFNEDTDFQDEEIASLRLRINELESVKNELLDQIDLNKNKARVMLMQRDLSMVKLKIIISKFEHYLKQNLGLIQEDINRIAALKDEEIMKIQEQEKELEDQMEIGEISVGIIQHVEKQLNKNKTDDNEQAAMKHLEYIRNVFVKYLEYLALNNTKEIHTIEHVLFTELNVTKEQSQQLAHLRKQNTFWKKIIPLQIAAIPQQSKSKFSAGGIKKKLLGGVGQFLNTSSYGQGANVPHSGNPIARTSQVGQHNILEMNKSLTSPFNNINNFNTMSGYPGSVIGDNDLSFNSKVQGHRLASDCARSPARLEEVKVNKFPPHY